MTRPFSLMTHLGIAAGLVGAALAPVSSAQAVYTPAPAVKIAAYTYSSTLVSRYTAGCVEKLQARGKSAAQAQRLCQCSMQNMQAQHSQGQAILILTTAQFSGSKDPNTGLPTSLSKYFSSCKA